MNIIQLNAPISVETPLGHGYAILFEGGSDDNFWTVALSDSCAIVTFRQEQIRISRSYTYGRKITDTEMKKIITRKKRNA